MTPDRASTTPASEPRGGAHASIFEGLWRAHRRWVAAILLAHMPREAEVDDLLQEVAMRLARHTEGLHDEASVRAWLRTVAVNVARTAGRRQKVRRAAFPRIGADPTERAAADGDESRVDDREEGERALVITRELPEEYREPLLLRAVRGMSYRQIADVLGLPVTTVETRLVRARRMVRERMELDSAESASKRNPANAGGT